MTIKVQDDSGISIVQKSWIGTNIPLQKDSTIPIVETLSFGLRLPGSHQELLLKLDKHLLEVTSEPKSEQKSELPDSLNTQTTTPPKEQLNQNSFIDAHHQYQPMQDGAKKYNDEDRLNKDLENQTIPMSEEIIIDTQNQNSIQPLYEMAEKSSVHSPIESSLNEVEAHIEGPDSTREDPHVDKDKTEIYTIKENSKKEQKSDVLNHKTAKFNTPDSQKPKAFNKDKAQIDNVPKLRERNHRTGAPIMLANKERKFATPANKSAAQPSTPPVKNSSTPNKSPLPKYSNIHQIVYNHNSVLIDQSIEEIDFAEDYFIRQYDNPKYTKPTEKISNSAKKRRDKARDAQKNTGGECCICFGKQS